MRVAIALDDLGSDGRDVEAQLLADFLFDFRAEVRGVADGAGDFPEFHVASGFAEASDVALIFGEPVGDFEAKGDGLSVDAMGAADLRSVLEFVGAKIEDFAEEDEIAFDDVGGVANEQSLRGVHNVVGGHAVVQPAGGVGIANGFADGHGEGDDVVFDARFDFVDAVGVYFGAGAKNDGGVFRDEAGIGEGFGGGEFDVEPFLVFVGVGPDVAHFLACIAWNHGRCSPAGAE